MKSSSVATISDSETVPSTLEGGSKLMEETTSCIEVIETVISSLAQEDTAMVSHSDAGYLWKFNYGTIEVYVQLTGLTDEDVFTAWAMVHKLPVKNEAELMRKLLMMNWADTFESRFAISDDQVVVVATRSVAELSPGEISRSITIVATVADEQDEVLQSEFPAA